MNLNLQQLDYSLDHFLEPMGVRAQRRGGQVVNANSDRDALTVRLALPPLRVDVELDEELLWVPIREKTFDRMLRLLEDGQRRLFLEAHAHMARHDRKTVEYLQRVEVDRVAVAADLLEQHGFLDVAQALRQPRSEEIAGKVVVR